MKKLFTILLCLFALSAFAQVEEEKEDNGYSKSDKDTLPPDPAALPPAKPIVPIKWFSMSKMNTFGVYAVMAPKNDGQTGQSFGIRRGYQLYRGYESPLALNLLTELAFVQYKNDKPTSSQYVDLSGTAYSNPESLKSKGASIAFKPQLLFNRLYPVVIGISGGVLVTAANVQRSKELYYYAGTTQPATYMLQTSKVEVTAGYAAELQVGWFFHKDYLATVQIGTQRFSADFHSGLCFGFGVSRLLK